MPTGDDVSAFFGVSDFAESALWTPASGDGNSGRVIIDRPEQLSIAGEAIVDNVVSYFPADEFDGIASGDTLTIDGTAYRVLEVQKIEDGRVRRAFLREA